LEAAASDFGDAAPRLREGQPPQLRFALFMLFVLSMVVAPFFLETVARDAPPVRNGVLDVTGLKPLDPPVALEGDWAFEWQGPATAGGPSPGARYTMRVPGPWEDRPAPRGLKTPGRGRVAYSVTIRGLQPGPYRLVVPTIYMASRVTIDGKTLSQRGTVGTDAATTHYLWRAHDVSFEATGRPVTIRIDLASFLHRDSGLEQVPVIGTPAGMADWFALRWAQELLFHLSLVLLGLYSLVAFVFRRDDWPSLCFALCCFGLLPFSAILGLDNLLSMIAPGIGLLPLITILYLFTIAALAGFLIYADALFPAEHMRWPYRIAFGAVGLLFVAQAASLDTGDTLLASKVNSFLLYALLIVFGYVIAQLSRAAWHKRPGAVVFLAGIVMLATSAIVLALVAFGLVPSDKISLDIVSFGMLVMLFSHMVVLAERWSLATASAQRLSRNLRQMIEVNSSITSEIDLDTVLRRIVEGTSRILGAERSSLFLYDKRKEQLTTLVAEGVEERKIRVPADKGIVGRCFQTGAVQIVEDPYADPDFLSEHDKSSGFRTRNMIALPLITRDGRKLGVLQALNRIGGGSFDRSDAESMRAFSAQAAVALDNAQLFEDVTQSRKYSESVLRSMSNGVVTLNRAGIVTGLNDAACTILDIAPDKVAETDWQEYIAVKNPAVLEEIRNVAQTLTSKTLLDIDILTVPGNSISINLSIVQLMGEDQQQDGWLLIIEDISQGKRLEGAMRRFMTQEVMDQVLGQESDALFGAACSASVLFADIRGFTSIAEALSPRATVDMLNEIFTDLFEAVAEAGGVLDKYIGDAVMAVFGAPLSRGDDALNAVAAALRMQEMMALLNARRAERGERTLGLGIGVASGEVVAGTIGSPKRMDYTVIGDSVNLAARLQDLTKTYRCGILVCARTAGLVADRCAVRELDTIRVRGRDALEHLFEVITPRAGVSEPALSASIERYQTGRARLARRDWEGAIEAFDEALAHVPDDGPARLMRDRAARAMSDPPAADWDGVW
jgi:adenylate cyclase